MTFTVTRLLTQHVFFQVAHETCYLSWSHFRRQKESYLRDWQTQYRGLEVRVQRALEDYAEAVVMKEAGQVTMETQATLCRCLHEKVCAIISVD